MAAPPANFSPSQSLSDLSARLVVNTRPGCDVKIAITWVPACSSLAAKCFCVTLHNATDSGSDLSARNGSSPTCISGKRAGV